LARKIEGDLDLGRSAPPAVALTIADLIRMYRNLREKSRPILDTSNEHYMLKHLEEGLGQHHAEALTPQQLAA
jgi:hypothetical protein